MNRVWITVLGLAVALLGAGGPLRAAEEEQQPHQAGYAEESLSGPPPLEQAEKLTENTEKVKELIESFQGQAKRVPKPELSTRTSSFGRIPAFFLFKGAGAPLSAKEREEFREFLFDPQAETLGPEELAKRVGAMFEFRGFDIRKDFDFKVPGETVPYHFELVASNAFRTYAVNLLPEITAEDLGRLETWVAKIHFGLENSKVILATTLAQYEKLMESASRQQILAMMDEGRFGIVLVGPDRFVMIENEKQLSFEELPTVW